MFRVLPEGGVKSAGDDTLTVTNASAATVLVAFNTDFGGRDPAALCARQIAAAQEKGWQGLYAAHVADHERLFRRVSLDLGGEQAADRPTDVRLEAVRKGQADPQLAALFFQYGRYLVIAGSREDSPLPMHLQGIWNDNLACNMGWTCDFHLDINTAAELLADRGLQPQRVRGTIVPARSSRCPSQGDARHARPTASTGAGCAMCSPTPGGSPRRDGEWAGACTWPAAHGSPRTCGNITSITGDREFLARRAYPVLKGAAEFFLAYLVRDPGQRLALHRASVSPERVGKPSAGPDA